MPTEDLPSNSHVNRSESKVTKTPEQKEVKVQKVIEGQAVKRKKPFHKRFLETFVGDDDAAGVAAYVVQDVIVPATKDLLSDAFTTVIERVLYGESGSPRGRGRRGGLSSLGGRTDYAGMSARNTRREDPRGREMSPRGREAHDFTEIVLDTRADCDIVLEEMYEIYSKYQEVTVANLYSLVGQTSTFVDTKFGWFGPDALRGSHPVRLSGGRGYLLDLPRPEAIT